MEESGRFRRVQNACKTVQAVGNGRQIVAQAIVNGESLRRLPVIQGKESITPLADRTLDGRDGVWLLAVNPRRSPRPHNRWSWSRPCLRQN